MVSLNWRRDGLHAVFCTHRRSSLIITGREFSILSFGDHCLLVYSASGAFIPTITYGYNIEPHGEDPLVRLANLAVKKFSEAAVPGAWLVDFIPSGRFLPYVSLGG